MNDLRLIDRWFPVAAVDEAVGTPVGSGRNEKALFTWFASRPVAQARAAVLTATLGPGTDHRLVESAVREGRADALRQLGVLARGDAEEPPVVLDCFSGRGMIPLEVARLGLRSIGTDLSPVAVLASRLLADWPLRDWSDEPPIPFKTEEEEGPEGLLGGRAEARLLQDVRAVLEEVGRRTAEAVAPYYPPNPDGSQPWGTLWATTIPCDACGRRFPLIGALVLRHPERKRDDLGQSLEIVVDERRGTWKSVVIDGVTEQKPTFRSQAGRKGKAAFCPFACGAVSSLATVKAKGDAGEYEDEPVAVADLVEISGLGRTIERKVFRVLRADERAAIASVSASQVEGFGELAAVPDEPIPVGNEDTVRASAYGYRTFGELMNARQARQFVETVRAIRACHQELCHDGVSEDYAAALASYAAACLVRRIRRATRGSQLFAFRGTASRSPWVQAGDIFSTESKIDFNFDHFETGPGRGPGTWGSIAESGLGALGAVLDSPLGSARPARFARASARALPLRDGTVDIVVTDPPYYNAIDYADVSDLFYVWLRRCLHDIVPDLFERAGAADGLQDKSDELIVKRGGPVDEHRTPEWFETGLSSAFREMRRVLKPEGHLVVVYAHSDPEGWERMLAALREAGFVVTSAWPARTESGSSGVASLRVTVTIGCRVAPLGRPDGAVLQVEDEIARLVAERVPVWTKEGLALTDQLQAAFGPAMEVVGRYERVMMADGSEPPLSRFLARGQQAVREAHAMRVDSLPLETFDTATKFALFWLRAHKRTAITKGEARFHAQAHQILLEEVRTMLLDEAKGGYRLRLEPATERVDEETPTFEVVRHMVAAQQSGGLEEIADVLSRARDADDVQLWAVVGDLINELPASDKVAVALTICDRQRELLVREGRRRRARRSERDGQISIFEGAL